MRAFRLLVILVAAYTCRCYLVSDTVIGGNAAVFDDARLTGFWKQEGKPGYLMFTRLRDRTRVVRFFEEDFTEDKEYYSVVTTRVSDATFLNARRREAMSDKVPDDAYVPAYYEFRGETLAIALFATAPFNKAIAEKKIAGIAGAKTGSYSTSPTRLTGNAEQVAKFILAGLHKPGVLEPPVLLRRVVLK